MGGMKRAGALAVIAAIVLTACGVAMAVDEPHPNQVSYWCEVGEKFEPVDDPFIVPPPPTGWVWTLLVVKAGSGPDENEVFPYPVVGQGYSHPDHANSHVILCREPLSVDTTEEPPDDDPPDTTEVTETTEVTATTVPECPDCTPNTQVEPPDTTEPEDTTTTTTTTEPDDTTTTTTTDPPVVTTTTTTNPPAVTTTTGVAILPPTE